MCSTNIFVQYVQLSLEMISNGFRSGKIIFFIIVISLSLITAGGCSPERHRHDVPHTQHRFDDIEKWVALFEDPERAQWQKPGEVVQKLSLQAGDVIADIGAGTGYFTRLFAKAVGPQGTAFGLDIEPSMVTYMEKDARQLGLDNYVPRLIKPDDAELSPQSVNVIFMCNTLHHLEDRISYLTRLSQSLKPGGRIVIVDFYKKPLPVGPAPHMKLSRDDVITEFEKAGYRLQRSLDFLPYQYFLVFSL